MKESFFLYKSARGSCGSDVHKMSISIRNARDMDIRHELYRETISLFPLGCDSFRAVPRENMWKYEPSISFHVVILTKKKKKKKV